MTTQELKKPRTPTTKTRRRVGWMAAATLTVGALFAPAAAFAEHTVDLGASGADQSGLCEGDYFKIESTGVLVEGEHTYTGTTAEGVTFTVTLDVTLDDANEVDTITIVSSSLDIEFSVIKAGTEFFVVMGDTLVAENGKAISDVAFCLGETEVTTSTTTTDVTTTDTTTTDVTTTDTTTTDVTTTTDTTTTDVTTTDTTTTDVSSTTSTMTDTTTVTETTDTTVTLTTDTTVTDTTDVTLTSTDTVTSTPSSSVSGTVGGPAPTLPPTSTEGAQANGTSSTISFALLVLAAASLGLVMARPLATRKADDR